MADIYQFMPRQEIEAVENVTAFIDGCKNQLHTFGRDLDFSSNQWDVSQYIQRRGMTQRKAFTFSTFDTCKSRTQWTPMAEPFLSFVKAKIRYDFSRNPNEQHNQKMAALRALEKALVNTSADGVPRVENVNAHVLNLAAKDIQENNPSSAYQSGCHLEKTAKWLVAQHMVRAPFSWKSFIKKPADLVSRIGKEADEHRLKNIPSMAALQALPQIYANSSDPRDVLISSIAALLLCSPARFNEVFALPVKCEHIDHRPDGSEIYGLRWFTSKRGMPEIKKIIKTMEGVCKEALGRLRQVTEEARTMARWYAANPDKLYLPKRFEHFRNQELVTSRELAPLLGQHNSSKLCEWAKINGLEAIKVRPEGNVGAPANAYRFADIERVVCSMLPKGFPVFDPKTGMRYGDALLVVPRNFFHEKRGIWSCMFEVVDINTFNDQLGSGSKHGQGSIFSRNNYREDDGRPINLDSHDFRHFLTYLGKRKGVDRLILTFWAGRRHIPDTDAYGNLLTAEVTQLLKDASPDVAESLGLIGLDINDPVCAAMFMNARDVLELQYQYVHENKYGYCIHDYDRAPCQRRMQCLECTDFLCIKGHSGELKEKHERIREKLARAKKDLEILEAAIKEGIHVSGSKLHKYLQNFINIVGPRLAALDDPEVPVGSRIQLTQNAAPTPLDIAVTSRIAEKDRAGMLLAEAAAMATPDPTRPALPWSRSPKKRGGRHGR